MELDKTNFQLRDRSGNWQDVEFHVNMYNAANDRDLSLTQFLSRTFGPETDEDKFGTVMEQFMQSSGMYLGNDRATGLRAPNMREIMTDSILLQNPVTRPDDSLRNTPSGRLLFPEIIMQTIESELREDHDDFLGGWESMIAQSVSIAGPTFDQPIIDTTAPRDQAANPIAQLAPPDALVSITVSDTPRRITTKSIGMMISQEAQQASTLDLVTLAVTAHARQERVRMVEEHINGIVVGDVDRNESALSSVQADSFDPTIVAAGDLSHIAWIKYLRSNYRKRSINWIMCDLDTALAIEGRSGRPTRDTVFVASGSNVGVNMTIDNLAVTDPRVLIVDDGVIAANTIVGLDSRFGIRRVINVTADYQAVEEYVMRKGTGLRIDYGEIAHKLYSDAFDVMTLTV